MNNKRTLGISAGCVVAATVGSLLTRQPSPSVSEAGVSSTDRSHTGTIDHRRAGQDAGRSTIKNRTPEQLTALKNDLILWFKASPDAEHDWALREQVAAILATMSPGELKEFGQSLIPDTASKKGVVWPVWLKPLFSEVFRQWGLKDPAGACLGWEGSYFEGSGQAFKDWLRRDPGAARAWLSQNPFPPSREKTAAQFQQTLLTHEVTRDFSAARESLGTLDAETQSKMLLSWSQLLAHDPANRAEFLALLASRGDAELAEKCWQSLIREMAAKSPHDAAKFVETMDLPEEQKDKLSHQVMGEWAAKDPRQAFAAWAELKEDAAPAPLLKAMDSWSLNSPGAEQAVEWVSKLDPGPAREQFKIHMIDRMSTFGRYGQAAELSASLDDPAERSRQLKIVKRQWEEK